MVTGFVCGVFDLYHAGHALMFKECKENCDYLVVGLNSAFNLPVEKNKPIYSLDERKIILESIKYVDKVLVYNSEEELTKILKCNNFDIRFIGEDYKNKSITSEDLCKKIYFINRDHGISSSNIRLRIKLNNSKL